MSVLNKYLYIIYEILLYSLLNLLFHSHNLVTIAPYCAQSCLSSFTVQVMVNVNLWAYLEDNFTGCMVVHWLACWIANQEVRGSNPG